METIFKKKISKVLNASPEQVFLYWKGRVALYAILKAMNIKKGDELILPGFTCVVVPNAIKYLGATPVYVDIDRETLCPKLENIENAINPNTKAIICQNTFGLSHNVDKIVSIAEKHNLFTIEDCAHGFGGIYNGIPNGKFCDAAFFSTQWNKPFSTGVGGFALINNTNLIKKIEKINQELITPSFKDRFILKALLIAKRNLLNSKNYYALVRLYRKLSKYNLVVGSSEGKETETSERPEKYFKAMSQTQISHGIKEIDNIEKLVGLRKKNARDYTEFLKKHSKYHVSERLFDNHSFLKYPILVENRDTFESIAVKNNIELGDWFCSPIHPVKDPQIFNNWDLDLINLKNASDISKKVINLPTDVNDSKIILNFLYDNLSEII